MAKIRLTKIIMTLCFLNFLSNFSGFAQVDREFTMLHRNGKIYRQSKQVTGICGVVFRESTFDREGNLIRQEDWQNKKRCGITKIFNKSVLLKEIEFKDELMESYKAFQSNVIYHQISKDRNTLIFKGKPLVINWKRFYKPVGKNQVMAYNKKQLIDDLRRIILPEQILATLAEISKDYESKKSSETDSYLDCGSGSAAVKEGNISLTSTDPSQKKARDDKMKEFQNACGTMLNNSLSSIFKGLTGLSARNARIQNAQNALDKMIANCGKVGGTSSGGLISNITNGGLPRPVPYFPKPGQAIVGGEPVTLIDEKPPVMSVPPTEEGDAVDDTTEDDVHVWTTFPLPTAESLSKVAGYVAVGILTAAAIIAGAAAGTAAAGAAATAAVIVVIGASGTDGSGSGGTPDASIPSEPYGGCQGLQVFKDYCDASNWQDLKCLEFARLVSGCKGDIREMTVTPDGDITSLGCPASTDPEFVASQRCKNTGMVARPEPGGSVCRTNGPIDGTISLAPDPNVINPTRGDFGQVFKGTSYQVISTEAEINTVLKSTTQTIMLIFMDPDCSSCKQFSATLKSSDTQNAFKNNKILPVVVDAGLSMNLLISNKIKFFPTTVVYKSGKKTGSAIGSMSTTEVAKFISNYK